MAWNISERFPSWGETGEFPAAGFFYEGGDQVNEKHMDALWNGINGLEEDVQSALADIDSDSDGVVDEADTANLYKDNDIDSDGDGKVDAADDADTVGGEPPSNFADTNHGNEEHSSDFTTLTEVNNNADVPNADHADTAGDADTVDGQHASDISFSGDHADLTNVQPNQHHTRPTSVSINGDWTGSVTSWSVTSGTFSRSIPRSNYDFIELEVSNTNGFDIFLTGPNGNESARVSVDSSGTVLYPIGLGEYDTIEGDAAGTGQDFNVDNVYLHEVLFSI